MVGSLAGTMARMPLEFLRRKNAKPASAATPAAKQPAMASYGRATPLPEEAVAQEHQLRLSYAGRRSEGVRPRGGPEAMAALPDMVGVLAKSPIEVVEPRDPELGHAAPSIARAGEASQWLQAHGQNSPITRHALFVLESMDAIDPAFDTFVCALLAGDLDLAGYPEYHAIVGGV